MQAQDQNVALPFRSHTILGVCEGIGEDFGFNPVWLRIPLAVCVIWSPLVAFGTYFGLGAIVLASRFLFPSTGASAGVVQASAQPAPANEQAELAEAA